MRVWVLDDKRKHRASAAAQLGSAHDLRVFDSYFELADALKESQPDVLLTDLRLPGEEQTLGPEGLRHVGVEFDAGMFLVFVAAAAGVKKIAVVTDLNHHHHPASALLDKVNSAYWTGRERLFRVEDSQVLIAHAPLVQVDGEWVKDWAKALSLLLGEPQSEED